MSDRGELSCTGIGRRLRMVGITAYGSDSWRSVTYHSAKSSTDRSRPSTIPLPLEPLLPMCPAPTAECAAVEGIEGDVIICGIPAGLDGAAPDKAEGHTGSRCGCDAENEDDCGIGADVLKEED